MVNIIVPIDFSDNSIVALKVAQHLVDRAQGTIHLVNVFMPMGSTYSILQGVNMTKTDEIKKALEAQLLSIAKECGEASVKISVIEGDIVEGVLYASKMNNADLIIMGTKGKSNLTNVFMGSNAVSITQKSDIPVITVPQNMNDMDILKIVYASDFENIEKEMTFLNSLFTEVKWPIEVLHFYQNNAEKETIKSIFDTLKSENQYLTLLEMHEEKSLVQSIQSYVESQSQLLLVMFTEKRSFLEQIFKKSKSTQLAYNESVPLMVIRKSRVG